MKVLNLPELSNIETMKRRDIVAVINDKYVAPNEASKSRLELVLKKGRTVKLLIKYLGYFDKFTHLDKSSNDKYSIGEQYPFVRTRRSGSSYHFSQHYGEVFAISDKSAIIVFNGELMKMDEEE